MSSEEPDLPVAATVHRQYPNGDVRFHSIVENMVEEGDDLTPVRCAEEAIQEAREEARRQERQKILDKIDKEIKSTKKAAENAGVQVHDLYGTTAITALENLQDELEEEAEA